MPLSPGSHLGPYEVVALLGAGGMGEVYRARDTRLGREVAVKILHTQDRDHLRRFEQEARAASALNHPNIVVVNDVGTEAGIRLGFPSWGAALAIRWARAAPLRC